MTDWSNDSGWTDNVAQIGDFIRLMLDRANNLESLKNGRKADPRSAAEALLAGMQDGVEKFPPVASLQDALFAAMEAGDAEQAGKLGVLYGTVQGMVIGATVEPENQSYELAELRRKLAAKGGGKGKLTAADIEFAQTVVNDFCRRGSTNSFSAACLRAKKKLWDDRNVDIGDRRLRDILKDPTV